MSTQMIICIVIFAITLLSYILGKIPMWVTALLSMSCLFITKCIDAKTALSGFANTNTILMGTMFVVAAGFRQTTLVDSMCNGIMKLTRGSFRLAFFGYLLLAALLTNFIASPMVVYAIVSALLAGLCDGTGHSRGKYMFPLMVVCVSCCGILPLPTAIQVAGQFTGFLETYGFAGQVFNPVYFFIGEWPIIIVVLLWSVFLSGRFLPEGTAVLPAGGDAKARVASANDRRALGKTANTLGIIIFFTTIVLLIFSSQLKLATWFIALVGSLLMVVSGVLDQKSALRDIPWDMLMLYVGALALGNALTSTGAGQIIGDLLAKSVGGTHNNYVLGALFFLVPFILTQFMLNRAVSAVFVPIVLLACQSLGADPIGLMILVQAASLTAFMTPMATSAVPMCMADAGYMVKDLFKGGWLISIILAIVYIAYTMTVFPAF